VRVWRLRNPSDSPRRTPPCTRSSAAGPFFFGADPSLVDLTLVPHAYRYYVLEQYRGADFAIPRSDPALAACGLISWRFTSPPKMLKFVPLRLPDDNVHALT
jgi:hypothetical protein